jgi:broad specificity phosphatase PhoE
MRLILVRHGETTANVARLLDTAEPGTDLTDAGREQAAALPRTLDVELIDAVYASPLTRARRTAEPLADASGLEVQVRAGLREISAGALEMLGGPEPLATYLGTTLAWCDGDLSPTIPGGEHGATVLARFDEVVAEAACSGADTVVMISHGMMIRTWAAARSHNVTAEQAANIPLTNAGMVVLDGHPEHGWRALNWDGTSLP